MCVVEAGLISTTTGMKMRQNLFNNKGQCCSKQKPIDEQLHGTNPVISMTVDSVMVEANQIFGNPIFKKSISFTNYHRVECVWATESEFE